MTIRRTIVVALLLAVAVFILGDVAIHRARAVELRLHAMHVVSRIVAKFVLDNREWPRSWSELSAIADDRDPLIKWPRDAETVKGLVMVDFDARVADVARDEPSSFSAIRSAGPTFPSAVEAVVEVIDAARSVTRRGA